ncbi:uncharacterized protein LOC18427750 isoform X2 [Amborella trichopoda]|uniref:uncharacterized protein LOC18427750 isoform X2 n=1 Tax=Amborella trichopoda TaxID=13333 RepID=UPI0009BD6C03|nr:uncharacterized protein LOC18427750 isoform X2 [Amborella trichopoda]|eukprot:XP_020519078.1 uncharacterized protein LOC18427750 isoform X2 [Amborella trichopoda]
MKQTKKNKNENFVVFSFSRTKGFSVRVFRGSNIQAKPNRGRGSEMAASLCFYCTVNSSAPMHSAWLGKTLSTSGPFNSRSCQRVLPSLTIIALFWGSRKSTEMQSMDVSLGTFTPEGSATEVTSDNELKSHRISLSVASSITDISSEQWDACAMDATGVEKLNPFLTHAFLSSLEETGCAVKGAGWLPQHIIAKDQYDNIIVTGPRILIRKSWYKNQVFDKLVSALKDLTEKSGVSSLHITFPSEDEWHKMKKDGFLQRIGMQYHWKNRDYKSFDEFLMDLKQSKRKNIRQERKKISAQNLKIKRLRGDEIKARHWDSFYKFYQNTTDNKWGRAYLTRDFFHTIGSKLGDRVLLVVAEEEDELVAGALNLVGGDNLFGRLWGCHPRAYYPSLHFEACYYQAIEAAIELKLSTVEAGAQGEHKIQRGYLPVTTYSCHYIRNDSFKQAIEDFLVHETEQVKLVVKMLKDSSPFKEN